MDANGVVYSTIFYIFSYEFYFFKHLLKNNTCPFVLHELSFVCRFVDDLVILNFSNFESFMYLDQDSFSEITCSQKHLVGWIIFLETFRNLLDLDVKRSLQDNILYYLVIFLINSTQQKVCRYWHDSYASCSFQYFYYY
jgi:hypothetical protein